METFEKLTIHLLESRFEPELNKQKVAAEAVWMGVRSRSILSYFSLKLCWLLIGLKLWTDNQKHQGWVWLAETTVNQTYLSLHQ